MGVQYFLTSVRFVSVREPEKRLTDSCFFNEVQMASLREILDKADHIFLSSLLVSVMLYGYCVTFLCVR